MQEQKNFKKSDENAAIPDSLKAMAADVELRTRAGGMYTKEAVKRGEEIAKEIADPTK